MALVVFCSSYTGAGDDGTLETIQLGTTNLIQLAEQIARPDSSSHTRLYCHWLPHTTLTGMIGAQTLASNFKSDVKNNQLGWFLLTGASQTPPSPFDVSGTDLTPPAPYVSTDPATLVGWDSDDVEALVQVATGGAGIIMANLSGRETGDTGEGFWEADSSQTIHSQDVTGGGSSTFGILDSKTNPSAGARDMDVSVPGPYTGIRWHCRAVVSWEAAGAPASLLDSFFRHIRSGR
jgi:hypothetical protein